MQLTVEEGDWLSGACGPAVTMAMRILIDMGRILNADRLVPITSAHIDGCLYHGPAGLLFAERLVAGRGQVVVPTTLNVGSIDLKRPDRILLSEGDRALAERLMSAYEALGCAPTWTCAPYQAGHRPQAGSDIAWAESNAVVFANSVLGARTNRYGDFLDICAALTARVPRYGLHLQENRRARIVVDMRAVPDALKRDDSFYPILGSWLGRAAGTNVVAFIGLPTSVSEDQLKALGAAAASTGAVALFHVVGVTPEAATLEAALQHQPADETILVTADMVREARDSLSTVSGDTAIDVIALGSPHFSLDEFSALETCLRGRRSRIPFYVCTGRHVLDALDGTNQLNALIEAGVEIIVDTCVVATPILKGGRGGVLMTNSGKFAHYGPSNTGYETVYGSLSDCVETAVSGKLTRDEGSWS